MRMADAVDEQLGVHRERQLLRSRTAPARRRRRSGFAWACPSVAAAALPAAPAARGSCRAVCNRRSWRRCGRHSRRCRPSSRPPSRWCRPAASSPCCCGPGSRTGRSPSDSRFPCETAAADSARRRTNDSRRRGWRFHAAARPCRRSTDVKTRRTGRVVCQCGPSADWARSTLRGASSQYACSQYGSRTITTSRSWPTAAGVACRQLRPRCRLTAKSFSRSWAELLLRLGSISADFCGHLRNRIGQESMPADRRSPVCRRLSAFDGHELIKCLDQLVLPHRMPAGKSLRLGHLGEIFAAVIAKRRSGHRSRSSAWIQINGHRTCRNAAARP